MAIHLENAERIREEVRVRIDRVKALLAGPLSRLESLPSDEHARHPLVEVLHASEKWLGATDFASARVDGYSVEAMGLATLIDARAGDPALPELVAGMVVPEQYLHALGVLGTAFAMQTLKGVQTIELIGSDPSNSGRIPDIRIRMEGNQTFNIEAKAPRRLRGLRRPLTTRLAKRVIERAVSDAAAPVGGQLPIDEPGVVAIASHGLTDSDYETLRTAARRVLDRVGPEDSALMGVLLVNFYRALRALRSSPIYAVGGERKITHTLQLAFGSHREIIPNGGYLGSFRIQSIEQFEPAKDGFDFSMG